MYEEVLQSKWERTLCSIWVIHTHSAFFVFNLALTASHVGRPLVGGVSVALAKIEQP